MPNASLHLYTLGQQASAPSPKAPFWMRLSSKTRIACQCPRTSGQTSIDKRHTRKCDWIGQFTLLLFDHSKRCVLCSFFRSDTLKRHFDNLTTPVLVGARPIWTWVYLWKCLQGDPLTFCPERPIRECGWAKQFSFGYGFKTCMQTCVHVYEVVCWGVCLLFHVHYLAPNPPNIIKNSTAKCSSAPVPQRPNLKSRIMSAYFIQQQLESTWRCVFILRVAITRCHS